MSATITGRTSGGYRGLALRCPGCAASMTSLELPDAGAEVDVCEACGGMWVDWFDGEVRAIATETLRVSEPDLKAAVAVQPDADKPAEGVIGACPRCSKQLVAERYVMTVDVPRDTGRTSIVGGETGAELLRCEDCMGTFVSRSNAEVLAWLNAAEEPPPSRGPASLKPLPWERFVRVLKGFLGIK